MTNDYVPPRFSMLVGENPEDRQEYIVFPDLDMKHGQWVHWNDVKEILRHLPEPTPIVDGVKIVK